MDTTGAPNNLLTMCAAGTIMLTLQHGTGNIMIINVYYHVATFISMDAKKAHRLPLGLPLGEYEFVYDYPLKTSASFKRHLSPAATAADLMVYGRQDYGTIYAQEEAAVGNPGHITGMLNRAGSDGPYGIWGHDISDLQFAGIHITGFKVEFNIDS
jgi:hypothetical protein